MPSSGVPIADATFTIVSNGYADGPAQALRDYLIRRRVRRVATVLHPLTADDAGLHEVVIWKNGAEAGSRRRRLPSRVPLTYPLDLVVPLRPPPADCWIGFNSLACLRGLVARATGDARKVVYWCVDYVNDRFGGGLLTRVYERLDRLCCERADARFELSDAARAARTHRHQDHGLAPARVVPMGAWLDRVPKTAPDGYRSRTIVYLGHLVPRQGVATLIRAMALLAGWGDTARAEVIGRGPELESLRALAGRLGVLDRVRFRGFLPEHRDVEAVLAASSVAVAPYLRDADSFTAFADPGKLKAYLAAGLPILLTDVPPNAQALAEGGAAELLPAEAEAFARAARQLLDAPEVWTRRRGAALGLAARYDWSAILGEALTHLGYDCA